MPLTLLLLIFIIIAFISALTPIFKTSLLTIHYRLHFIFYKLDTLFNNFLFVTARENE